MPKKTGDWWVYVIECEGGWLYTGISNDPEKRFEKHKSGKGAAFMRLHKPLRILSLEKAGDYSQALRREAQLKGLPKGGKLAYSKDPGRLGHPDPKAKWLRKQANTKGRSDE